MTTIHETANEIRKTDVGAAILAKLDAFEAADADFDRAAEAFRNWLDESAQALARLRK